MNLVPCSKWGRSHCFLFRQRTQYSSLKYSCTIKFWPSAWLLLLGSRSKFLGETYPRSRGWQHQCTTKSTWLFLSGGSHRAFPLMARAVEERLRCSLPWQRLRLELAMRVQSPLLQCKQFLLKIMDRWISLFWGSRIVSWGEPTTPQSSSLPSHHSH